MNHEGKGEIPEEERVLPCHHRRVTFRSDLKTANNCNGDSDGKDTKRQKQQSPEYTDDSSGSKTLSDAESKKSLGSIVGILRPRSISPSPLSSPTLKPTKPRFDLYKLREAMRRSNETRGCIEKLKKQFFHHLDYQQREPETKFACSPGSQLKQTIENVENQNQSLSLLRQKRRLVCLQSAKAMMGQSLPPSMMPFVEETLRAAHFLRRRRKEKGHGRIVHQILIEQHKQVLKKELENRNGESSHSSRQQPHTSESS